MAMLCAGMGAKVALVEYSEKTAKETAELITSKDGICSVHAADISNLKNVQKITKDIVKKYGYVDVLINNAGIMPKFERFENTDYDVFKKILDVNLWGVIYCSKEFMPYLLQRPEAALVNISSAAGLVGYLGLSSYVASKFAVRGFSEALRMEYLGTGLTVSVVHPGAMSTNIFQNSPLITVAEKKAALSRGGSVKMTTANAAAKMIIDGMMAKKTKILVGSDAKMMDKLARLMPMGYTKMFYNKMKGYLPKK
jgi:butyryl-CoA dehydrogenase